MVMNSMDETYFITQDAVKLENGHYLAWGTDEFKLCKTCGTWLTIVSFAPKADSKDRLTPLCKNCAKARSAKWREEHSHV